MQERNMKIHYKTRKYLHWIERITHLYQSTTETTSKFYRSLFEPLLMEESVTVSIELSTKGTTKVDQLSTNESNVLEVDHQ